MVTQIPENTVNQGTQPTLAERLDSVTRIARRLFRVPIVLVSLGHDRLRLHTAQGVPASFLGNDVPFDAATLASKGPLVIADTLADERFANHPWVTGRPNVRFCASALVLGPEGEVNGILSVCDRSPNALAEADLILLRDMAKLIESELQVAALPARSALPVQAAPAANALRGHGWNRHALFELLDREFQRARPAEEGVAVVLAEIDHFESITKQHGSDAGMSVLQEVNNRFRAVVRRSDTVSRFGLDEFLIFLGQCDLDDAFVLAERMRQRIRKTPVAAGAAQIPVSMTFGVAAGDDKTEWTPDSLVRRADEALAEAVKSGRDRVVGRKL